MRPFLRVLAAAVALGAGHFALAGLAHATAGEKVDSAVQAASGAAKKTGRAVKRGASAATTGLENGAAAAASGVERGAKAAGRAADRGAKKVGVPGAGESAPRP